MATIYTDVFGSVERRGRAEARAARDRARHGFRVVRADVENNPEVAAARDRFENLMRETDKFWQESVNALEISDEEKLEVVRGRERDLGLLYGELEELRAEAMRTPQGPEPKRGRVTRAGLLAKKRRDKERT